MNIAQDFLLLPLSNVRIEVQGGTSIDICVRVHGGKILFGIIPYWEKKKNK